MSPSASTPRLTDRDHALLGFAAEQRFVLAGQIARQLDISQATAGRRLETLRDAGLLSGDQTLRHETTAFAITRTGLAVTGCDLSVPRPLDLAFYRHDVGVGWLAADAHRGVFGELSAVVGERRMRSEDRRADRDRDVPPHGVRLAAGRGSSTRLHYPDLVLVTAAGQRVAVELELSTKPPARRERILSAYASDPRIDAVVYLVATGAAAAAITRSATRVGARDLVQVQRFAWAGGRAPGGPPRRTRSVARPGALEVSR